GLQPGRGAADGQVTGRIETVASGIVVGPDQSGRALRTTRGPRYEAAELGFRHYWYPALLSRDLGATPKAVKLLGDNLVFVRAHGQAHALFDRCAHRGKVLSAGQCVAERSVTCPYLGSPF